MNYHLYSWNVNGIRAAADKGLLAWLATDQPQILCLQEIKAEKEQLRDEIACPAGYHVWWHSAERKGYSGTALLSKPVPIRVTFDLEEARFKGEGRLIVAEYDHFFLLNVYIPNGKRDHSRVDYKLAYSEALLERCQELRKSGKGIIIGGDMNTAHKEIDLKHPQNNQNTTGFLPRERAWIDYFLSHGYVDTFRHFNQEPERYTWWSYRLNARKRNIGWRFDYFFVNEEFLPLVKRAGILPEIQGSDHCPVFLEINSERSEESRP